MEDIFYMKKQFGGDGVKRIAVFCGSRDGGSAIYKEGALQLGKELAKRGITLVYGGSSLVLMGAIADTVLKHGGKAIGVIPDELGDKEKAHRGLTEFIQVKTMHERKAKMADLADGFIAMPGGTGTLDEFIEIFTWQQIGLHRKPCGLLNINQYYDPLLTLFQHMANEQFLDEKYRDMAIVGSDPATLIDQFYTYDSPGEREFEE